MGVSVNTQEVSRTPLEVRLMRQVEVTESGCWVWAGSVTQHGYGRMSWKNHVHRTHRLAAHLWLGLDLGDTEAKVCHTCDNPPCLNPEHLYIGTQKSNVADMLDRGRAYKGPDKWTHCAKGHELSPDNRSTSGRCRTCWNEYQRNKRARLKAATVQAIEGAISND